jgi:transcriptional regulator with XRE-family HTH domain
VADDRQDQAEQRFSANLRVAREREGMSQAALAGQMRELGYDSFRQNTIYRIETGRRSVGLGEAQALALITRTSIDRLAQPPELAKESWLILEALRRFREAGKQLRDLGLRRSNTRAELERLVRNAREAGHADHLAREIAAAERALAGSSHVTASDRWADEATDVLLHGPADSRKPRSTRKAAG